MTFVSVRMNNILMTFTCFRCKTCSELSSTFRIWSSFRFFKHTAQNVCSSPWLANDRVHTSLQYSTLRRTGDEHDRNRLCEKWRLQQHLCYKHTHACSPSKLEICKSVLLHQNRRFHTHIPLCNPGDVKHRERENDEPTKDPDKQQVQDKDDIKDIKENIYTIPNFLTCLRIALTPYLGYLVLTGGFDLGFKLFVLAGISDFLDGYIARNFKNQQTILGSALDPFADKMLISVLTITLTVANLLPVPLTFIIVGRDVLLLGAGFYLRYISLPPPRNLTRYFDVSNATMTLLPSTFSKLNTGLQLALITATLAAPVFSFVGHPWLQALWVLTGVTTLASGVQYYVSRNKYIKFSQQKLHRKI